MPNKDWLEQAQNKVIQKLRLQLLVSLLVSKSVSYLVSSLTIYSFSQSAD
jgi:hypothetical protein